MKRGAWPEVPLAEILTHYTESIAQPEPKIYPKLSVRLYGRGVVLDTPADGSLLKMRRHQIAKRGQVILSEIWGKKGAIGLVPEEGDGALCTSHFFLFDVQEDKIDRKYLGLIFAANRLEAQLDAGAKGSTGYAAVRPRHLLGATVPLPPLNEQRRIVGRIEEIAGKIEEARGLRGAAEQEAEAMLHAILFDGRLESLPQVPIAALAKLRDPDVVVDRSQVYEFAGVYSFGRGVFRGPIKPGLEFSYERLTRLRVNDFVYPKLMAWEGAFGVVPPECEGLVVSPEFPVFELDTDKVLPEVFDIHFRSPSVWPSIAGASTGTNVRRRRLHPSAFLRLGIPPPPMEVQLRLRAVSARVAALKQLQSETAGGIEALLPSVLERAFRGEL